MNHNTFRINEYYAICLYHTLFTFWQNNLKWLLIMRNNKALIICDRPILMKILILLSKIMPPPTHPWTHDMTKFLIIWYSGWFYSIYWAACVPVSIQTALRTLPSGSGQSTYSTMIVVNFLRICQTDQMLSDPLMQWVTLLYCYKLRWTGQIHSLFITQYGYIGHMGYFFGQQPWCTNTNLHSQSFFRGLDFFTI